MIGGTSGSETKLCQPSASQSNSTHTRSASLGSRKTVAPFEPCSLRFSAPLVEKMSRKRSKSSTCVVARIMPSSLSPLGISGRRRCAASVRAAPPQGNGANALYRSNEVVLEGPQRRRGTAAHAGLLVDVFDVMTDGLGRDVEVLGDLLI